MANTIPDVAVSGTWVDAYVAASISPGTTIVVQNKSSDSILIVEGTAPLSSSRDGVLVAPLSFVIIDGAPTNVWIKTCNGYSGNVHIEAA